MELIKKNIHMNRLKEKLLSQLTLEDDFNVSDVKPDIDRIIKDSSEIKIEEIKVQSGKVYVKGRLCFKILYCNINEERNIHNLEGNIQFEELLNAQDIDERDTFLAYPEIEDINIEIINSRKFSVKAIISLNIFVETLYDEKMTIGVDSKENEEFIQKRLNVAEIVLKKKDIYRIKEEIDISANKPNISEILWDNTALRNYDIKLIENKVNIKGEIVLFILYSAHDHAEPIQWMETTIPFSGMIDANGCNDSMISNIDIKMQTPEIEIKEDMDGESRKILLDVLLNLDMNIYKEDSVDIPEDVYSPVKEIVLNKETVIYENILMKNTSKLKITDKMEIEHGKGQILQLCNNESTVKIDYTEITEEGIEISGVLNVSSMYISSDDKYPLCNVKSIIPFNHLIEVPGITKENVFYLKNDVDSLNAVMMSSEEIEIKAILSFNVLVINKLPEQMIVNIESRPIDIEKIQNMPGIVGCFVQEGDTLWKIAKRYHTGVESLKIINDLSSEHIKKGDKLVVVKQVGELKL